jgi:nitroimidazol reductase NimA-like FMN-containing flavoprotein (pyridoxamine 5'-phosphate oxidase superfamily)
MDHMDAAVVSLDDDGCFELLSKHELGRLVTSAAGVLDIFPVNYALDGRTIVIRTAEGSKLMEMTINDEVLFEVDAYTDADAWSVVVRGHARRLETSDEVRAADELPLKPWIPTLKYNYVRITPDSVSGRAFRRGEEPDRYGIQQY